MTSSFDLRAWQRADRSTRILMLILLAALAIRLLYALSLGHQIAWYDGREYSRLATGLLEQRAYTTVHGAPSGFWPPGYPFFLAAIYAVFGPGVTAVRICEAALGVLICLLAFLLARACVGRRASLVSAGLAAIYPLHIYMVGTFFATTLQTVLVASAAYFLIQAAARGSAVRALIGGIFGGWAALTAATVLPALLLSAGWVAWASHRARRRWWPATRLAILVLVPILVIVGAWTVRNTRALGQPVLVSLNGGENFWLGNYPGVTAATGNRMTPEMREELFAIHAQHPDEVARDRAFYRRGLEFVQADPWRFLTLSLSKAIYLWHLWPQPMTDQGHPDTLVILGSVLSYGVLLVPALIGLARALRRRPEAWLVLLFCLSYSAVHALYISKVRLRLPLDTFVIIYGAAGLLWILGRISPRWRDNSPDEDAAV